MPPARGKSKAKSPATADEASGTDVFDVRKIRRFVELMNEHELTEIDLKQGEQRIRLRRGGEAEAAARTLIHRDVAAPPPMSTVPAAPPAEVTEESEADATFIRSPMVGTFYNTPGPGEAAFVKVGDQVGPESTVCIVEAMKVFNEIPAECSGKIVAILVENGESVEYGQPLFKVETAA